MGKKKIKVAGCQINCIDDDREGNFCRIEQALEQLNKADLACFSECSLLGWVNPNAHNLASRIPGSDTKRLSKLAKKYKIMLSIGLAEKEKEKLYDSAILMDATGKILLKHRKINILAYLMTPPYTPGNNISVTETSLGRIGLLICADTFRKDLLNDMLEKKPVILIVPYGWAEKRENWPQHGKRLEILVKYIAKKVNAYVIGTDLVGEITNGPWKGYVYGGQSIIVDRKGQVLAIGKDREPEIIIKELIIE
jgi:predicted amidohydrolase